MFRSRSLTAFCAAFLLARSACPATPMLSSEEQDVIEAALRQSKNVTPAKRHVVSAIPAHGEEKARYERFAANLREQAKGEGTQLQEAVENFLSKDKDETELIFPRPLPSQIVVITRADERQLTSGGSIDIRFAVQRRFRGSVGLIQVSRPGFDRKHTTAIIYVSETSGTMSGIGSFHILRQARGKWHIDKNQSIGPTWIAAR
jgi:hypothetical protein